MAGSFTGFPYQETGSKPVFSRASTFPVAQFQYRQSCQWEEEDENMWPSFQPNEKSDFSPRMIFASEKRKEATVAKSFRRLNIHSRWVRRRRERKPYKVSQLGLRSQDTWKYHYAEGQKHPRSLVQILSGVVFIGHRPISLKFTFTLNEVPIPPKPRVMIPEKLA